MWVLGFDFFVELFPESVGWSDDMIESVAVQAQTEPVLCRVDDMFLGFQVVEVEFRDVSDAEEAEVLVRPAGENEPVFVSTRLVLLGVCKERVMSRTVVGDEICDDAKMVVMGLFDEFLEVFTSPEVGVDLVEIRDVIPMVHGGLIEGGDPQGGDPKVTKIRDFFDDAPEVSSQELWLIPLFFVLKTREPINEDMIDTIVFQLVRFMHHRDIGSFF